MTLIRLVPARRTTYPATLGRGGLAKFVEAFFGDGWLERNLTNVPEPAVETVKRVAFRETDTEYSYALETPGFDKESVKVEVEGDVLTIRGAIDDNAETAGTFAREFIRRVRIPGAIAAEGHKAEVKNGILTVTLAKPTPRSNEPLKITIN